MQKSAARWGWLGIAAFVAMPCLADTITLDNGDHLTGNIVRMEGGKVVINTSYAGDSVPRRHAREVYMST